MEAEFWEDDDGEWGSEPRQTRSVCLGSWMHLSPSGKIYMPWATSNLDPCPVCNGSGRAAAHGKARVRKRARARYERLMRIAAKRRHSTTWALRTFQVRKRALAIAQGSQCGRCGGYGSHEAWDDECWRECLESEAEGHGYYVDYEDDVVRVCEFRDSPDGDEEDEMMEESLDQDQA